MDKFIKITEKDNVCIALSKLLKGESVCGVLLLENIDRGHKFAVLSVKQGEDIIKYGYSIGKAKKDIKAGEHVHTHNVITNLNDKLEYSYNKITTENKPQYKDRKVFVYERGSGEIGIRNELWVIPTVGCVNAQAKRIAEEFNNSHKNLSVDAVTAFSHPYGCSQLGGDHERTKRTLQKMAKHPNAGGVLILGLGCENNGIEAFKQSLGDYDKDRVFFLNAQDVSDEISEGVKLLNKLYETASKDKRTERELSCVKVGLKCGGSDGLSGITANPLLGLLSDYLVSLGGTTVLTEVPEMFGAETLLMQRAKDNQVFDKTVKLINNFKDYFKSNGQVIYENPSPGNKAGGITTLEDKSLGCTQKGGSSEVADVLFENDILSKPGLNLLDGVGNDMVAVTNLGAAGCHLVLFTTGRGTPFGGFIPTIKISTNDALFINKRNWIDFNAGEVLKIGFDAVFKQFIDYIVEVINGQKTKNEQNNTREIAIFKTGITL